MSEMVENFTFKPKSPDLMILIIDRQNKIDHFTYVHHGTAVHGTQGIQSIAINHQLDDWVHFFKQAYAG